MIENGSWSMTVEEVSFFVSFFLKSVCVSVIPASVCLKNAVSSSQKLLSKLARLFGSHARRGRAPRRTASSAFCSGDVGVCRTEDVSSGAV